MASTTTMAAYVRIVAAQGCYVDFTTPSITEITAGDFTPDLTQELVLQKIIHKTRPTVYRGTLDGTPVIVKIALNNDIERLSRETRRYFALEDLQGTVIPRCYNHVIGSTPIKGQTKPSDIECLILEDCGEPVEDFFCLKLEDRIEILNGLLAIHARELDHTEFVEKHVVRGSQGYRITGLKHISRKHQCPWDSERDNWNVGGYYNKNFPCEGLKTAGVRMNIWRRDTSYIIASHVSIVIAQGFYVDFTTPCTIESKYSGFTPDHTQELVLQEIVRDSQPAVYRGTLNGMSVVVKIALDRDISKLKKEARNYFVMEDLQGTVIPHCYNYAIGSIPIDGETRSSAIGCLILEDCGESVEDFFSLKLEEKKKILDGLLTMHMDGFDHTEFVEKHVVRGSQGYRITGLKHISRKHQCPWDSERDNWNVGGYYNKNFPCKGLKMAGTRMDIWRKDVGYVIASHVRIRVARNLHADFTTPCITESRASGSTPDVTQELILQKDIQLSQYFSSGYYEVNLRPLIYRGTLDGTPVVVKIVFDSDKAKLKLREEANNYFTLEDLQGSVIPRCYNYVIGSTPIKGQTKPSDIAFLILEDCGEPVGYFPSLKLKDRMEILNKLLTMHMHGFHHSDFAERNVVLGPHGHRIIDLERMSKHQCLWKYGHVTTKCYEDIPSCGLRSAGVAMRIWREADSHIKVLIMFVGDDLELLPPREIMDCLIPSGIGCTSNNMKVMKRWLKEFKKEMEDTPDCNVKELVLKYQANPPHIPDICSEKQVEFKKYIPKSSRAHVRILAEKHCSINFTNPCIVESEDESSTPNLTQELILQRNIRGSHCRGTLDGIPVIVKIKFDYDIDELKKEAKNYFAMKDLQGTVIPRCYNYFTGSTRKGEREPIDIGCLILEDCGEPLQSFNNLKPEDSIETWNKLLTMHMHGFHHSSFTVRNVVRGPHGHRIVNLGDISKYQCPWELNVICEDRSECFPCRSLEVAGHHLCIWKKADSHIKVLIMFVGGDLELLPSGRIMDCLIPSGLGCTAKNVELIKGWLKEFKKELDSNPDCNVNELIAKYQANLLQNTQVCFKGKAKFKEYSPKSSTEKSSNSGLKRRKIQEEDDDDDGR